MTAPTHYVITADELGRIVGTPPDKLADYVASFATPVEPDPLADPYNGTWREVKP